MSFLLSTYKKNKCSSIIIGFIFIFLFSIVPNKANAYAGVLDVSYDPINIIPNTVSAGANTVTAGGSTVTAAMTTAEKIKVFILDPAARASIRIMIQRLTMTTVNWINSGFQGNPGFVTDPKQFFLNVGDTVASNFLSGTSLNQLCVPFKASVRLALVKNYISEQQTGSYSCTLSILKNNYQAFGRDFSQGGWEGWFELTQNNNNNPYTVYSNAEDELSKQIEEQEGKVDTQLSTGNNFLSFEKCKPSSVLSQSDINSLGAAGTKYKPGDCWINPKTGMKDTETVTPGSVIEKQLEGALGTGLKQLELAKSFDEILQAAVTQLYSRVVSGTQGLLDRTPGGQQLPPPPAPGQPTIVKQGSDPFRVLTGTRYNDPGVVAFDSKGNDITSQVIATGTVYTSVPKIYTVTYSVTDKSTGLSATTSREVIVGLEANKNGNCLTKVFLGVSSNWIQVMDSFTIRYGSITKFSTQLRLGTMIRLGFSERDYLKSQNQNDVVSDLEDLLNRLNDFKKRIAYADSNDINDVLQLQKERDDIKQLILQLRGSYSCPVPDPTYNATPVDPNETPDPSTGGQCTTPPSDGDTKHGNHQAEVAAAKAQLVAGGLVLDPNDPNQQQYECNRFEIVKLAAQMIGGGAGVYSKPAGTNCSGYSVDIIAYDDGYIYDVLGGGGDGANPFWNSATCLPADPSRYRTVP